MYNILKNVQGLQGQTLFTPSAHSDMTVSGCVHNLNKI